MVVTWFVTSQAFSRWFLKWAKDSEISWKTTHKKRLTTFQGNYFCPEWMNSSIIWKYRISCDLFYEITSKLDILVGHSGQIFAGAISTIINILNLTVIECHLGGPFSVVFSKKENNYSHVTHFITCYWSYNIKVIKIGQAANRPFATVGHVTDNF